jgi:protein-S-isoprenylcysteine O-methyltransferase Ste14
MAILFLVLLVGWLVAVGIVPTLRRAGTGSSALRHFPDPAGSPQWWARLLALGGILAGIVSPFADLLGLLEPFSALAAPAFVLVGTGAYATGFAITLVSQAAMGASWRIDVDPDVRTELVTSGPFQLVRNPIQTGIALTAIGLFLVLPSALSGGMLVAFLAAQQVQVRLVEEPYLSRLHGEAYRGYAARTGRFLPGIGRLRAP